MDTLSYAKPIPNTPRPAMYRLVITILLASAVLTAGIAASGAFFAIIFQPNARVFAIAPFVAAALFLFVGIRSMWAAVQYLRGRPPADDKAERWVFTVQSSWF